MEKTATRLKGLSLTLKVVQNTLLDLQEKYPPKAEGYYVLADKVDPIELHDVEGLHVAIRAKTDEILELVDDDGDGEDEGKSEKSPLIRRYTNSIFTEEAFKDEHLKEEKLYDSSLPTQNGEGIYDGYIMEGRY